MLNNKVLTIGPDYRKLKGGIASLLEVYSLNDPSFKFLPTYSSENNFVNITLFPIRYITIIAFLIFHKQYNIVHVHGSSHISFYRKYVIFWAIKYLLNRKIIYHIHGGAFHKFEKDQGMSGKKLIHHMINQSDVIICLSVNWKDYFTATFKSRKVYILNNIIPYPIKSKSNNLKDEKKIQFVFLGKICPEKGIFDLLQILHLNKDSLIGKLKVIIGGNGETSRLLNEINHFQLNELVEFVGWVSGEEKQNLLSQSDVFILPSYYEGLPISILEAMSYKMPVIASNVGGIPSIVKNGVNGFLIEPGNLNSIYNSIFYFLDNPESITLFGKNSYKAAQNFLPEKVIQELHIIYKSL